MTWLPEAAGESAGEMLCDGLWASRPGVVLGPVDEFVSAVVALLSVQFGEGTDMAWIQAGLGALARRRHYLALAEEGQ